MNVPRRHSSLVLLYRRLARVGGPNPGDTRIRARRSRPTSRRIRNGSRRGCRSLSTTVVPFRPRCRLPAMTARSSRPGSTAVTITTRRRTAGADLPCGHTGRDRPQNQAVKPERRVPGRRHRVRPRESRKPGTLLEHLGHIRIRPSDPCPKGWFGSRHRAPFTERQPGLRMLGSAQFAWGGFAPAPKQSRAPPPPPTSPHTHAPSRRRSRPAARSIRSRCATRS